MSKKRNLNQKRALSLLAEMFWQIKEGVERKEFISFSEEWSDEVNSFFDTLPEEDKQLTYR